MSRLCLTLLFFVLTAADGRREQHAPNTHHHHHYYGDVHNDHHSGEDHHSDEDHHEDDRVYRFQVGEDLGAYVYKDSDGYMQGAQVDLIRAMCRHANKKCYYIMDTYKHCWQTQKRDRYGGVGLLDGWYDACMGMLPSPERLNTFNFSLPFFQNVASSLHFKPGLAVEHPEDIKGKKIGFITGWVFSPTCLARQGVFTGNHVGEYEAVFFNSHLDMVEAVKHREIDAALTVDIFEDQLVGLEAQGPHFHCTLGGASLMAVYGNDVIDWWNEAFHSFRSSGQFAQFCRQANIKHASHGKVDCLQY